MVFTNRVGSRILLELHWRAYYLLLSWILCLCISYVFSSLYIYWITKPFLALDLTKLREFTFTGFWNAFSVHIFLSLFVSVFFCLPLSAYYLSLFILPAMYQKHRIQFQNWFGGGFVLFYFVQILIFSFLLPSLYSFFLQFEEKRMVTRVLLESCFSSFLNFYFSFVSLSSLLILIFLWIWFQVKRGNLRAQSLWKNRRPLMLIQILGSAWLAPPDLISQLFLCLICFFQIEICIFYASNQEAKSKLLKESEDLLQIKPLWQKEQN